uniref:cystathionine gamma-lyase n=1 Tax=Echinostoma caproni TaxID=27848 RepID=A0A183AXT9_9TREM
LYHFTAAICRWVLFKKTFIQNLIFICGRYLRTVANKAGITYTMVDMRDEVLFRQALQPNTRLVLLETPSNPLMRLVDIEQIVRVTREYNKDILVAVDNTFMTPYFQRPLDHGADISWHSLTKYMNGHADVVMGAVITKNNIDLPKKLAYLQLAGGAVPSPFDCYMCLRGIRTLAVRMQAHMRSALIVALMLERHPCVERVIHPVTQNGFSQPQIQSGLKGKLVEARQRLGLRDQLIGYILPFTPEEFTSATKQEEGQFTDQDLRYLDVTPGASLRQREMPFEFIRLLPLVCWPKLHLHRLSKTSSRSISFAHRFKVSQP